MINWRRLDGRFGYREEIESEAHGKSRGENADSQRWSGDDLGKSQGEGPGRREGRART